MTPIEAAARAINDLEFAGKSDWRDFVPSVRAVIAAIREPSENMVEAGWDWDRNQDGVTGLWRDMIDALLAEAEHQNPNAPIRQPLDPSDPNAPAP